MSQPKRTLRTILARGVLGFTAGFIVAFFLLVFLGVSHGHWDLNARELEQEYRAQGIALLIATGMAILAAAVGTVRVPRILATFAVAFALIAVIPFWPCGLTGQLLPFGTPYINWGYSHADAVQLACHIAVAIVLAGVFEGVWKAVQRRRISRMAEKSP